MCAAALAAPGLAGGAAAASQPPRAATTPPVVPEPTPPATPTATATANPTGTESTTLSPTPSSPVGSTSATASASPTPAPSTPTRSATPAATPRHTTGTRPAAATSTVPHTSILIALAVLAVAAVVVGAASRRSRPEGDAAPQPASGQLPGPPSGQQAMVTFLVSLGEAMIDSGDSVTHVQDTLRRVAQANHLSATGIVVLPTALIVSLPGEGTVQTSVTVAGSSPLRLDQIDAVSRVATEAESGRLGPAEGVSRLAAARTLPSPFSVPMSLAGHVVLTLGLALILGGRGSDLIVSALLGAAVGAAQLTARRLTGAYQVFVPVLSAFGVAVIVFLLPRTGLDVGVLAPLIAPLVMFLPGALLTTSVIELATGQMISGASRLVAGAMQLTLLAFGLIAGAQLVGVPATRGLRPATQLLDLAPWIGVALFGAGVIVHRSARRETAGWILLVLYVAYAGQVLGGFLLGPVLSGFAGALLMTPFAAALARLRTGPPTLVSFLPAFWLLVPGALGLVGVTQILGPNPSSGFTSLLTTGATMIGIAFGVLLGLAAAGTIGRYRGRAAHGSTSGAAA